MLEYHNNGSFIISVEKRKEAHGDSLDKQHKKKIEREEERLKNNNRDLSLVKMKSMFAIGFAFTALLSMFNSMLVSTDQFIYTNSFCIMKVKVILPIRRYNFFNEKKKPI